MSWTAVVPLKIQAERKSRLAGRLSPNERVALSVVMFAHVIGVLTRHPRVGQIFVLSNERPIDWEGGWITDKGRGLNFELSAARDRVAPAPLLVLHADLPLLAPSDVDALLQAGDENGFAIAPDRHRTGTNGVAIKADVRLDFRFGPESFRLHRDQVERCAVVDQPGLALDLDTPEDLRAFFRTRWRWEPVPPTSKQPHLPPSSSSSDGTSSRTNRGRAQRLDIPLQGCIF